MTRLTSSFDRLDMNSLLSRSGATAPPPKRMATSAKHAIPEVVSVKDQVMAVKEPGQRALGAALSSMVGDLARILKTPLFVADHDGLLLAGDGDTPTLAASIAADALGSLNDRPGMTAATVDGLLLNASPHHFLVFSGGSETRRFVIGAQVHEQLAVDAVRAAVGRIVQTLVLRTSHA